MLPKSKQKLCRGFKKSWVRENYRIFTRKFEVVSEHVSYDINPKKMLAARIGIKFTKDIKKCRLVLRVYNCVGLPNSPAPYQIEIAKLVSVIKGQIYPIELAKIAIPHPGWTPFYSGWGSGMPGIDRAIAAGSKNVAVLELHGAGAIQRHRFCVVNLQYGSVGTGDFIPMLYMYDEDDEPFYGY